MKNLLVLLLLSVGLTSYAQNSEEEAKQTIVDFFEAFHKQDIIALKSFARKNVILQSVSVNQDGKTILSETPFDKFIASIGGIPKTMTFEERILSYDVKVDGVMANVWTPYEFYVNEKLSHKGVNSFQLIKENDAWEILYLIDTRRR